MSQKNIYASWPIYLGHGPASSEEDWKCTYLFSCTLDCVGTWKKSERLKQKNVDKYM